MLQSNNRRYLTQFMLAMFTASLFLWTVGCAEEDTTHHEDTHSHTSSNPATSRPSADGEVQGKDDYPLTTCVVSGDPLDSFGEPFVIRYQGREVRFCCESCVDTFNEDPPKYLAILDQATTSK